MDDIIEAFERRFFPESAQCDNALVAAYGRWLLGNRKSAEPALQNPGEKAKADAWYARCETLFQEAKNLAAAGEQRGGLAFDSLKRKSLAIADEMFPRQERGCVFARVAQIFDEIVSGGRIVDASSVSETWSQYPYLPPNEFSLVREIEKFASWGADSAKELGDKCARFKEGFPRDVAVMEAAISNGQLFKKLKDQARQMAWEPSGRKKLDELIKIAGIPTWQGEKIMEAFDAGKTAKARISDARRLKKMAKGNVENQDVNLNGMQQAHEKLPGLNPAADRHRVDVELIAGHPNSILNLKPAHKWTIVADETGVQFGRDAFTLPQQVGRYVFVLIPDYAKIPPLPIGWHAVDESLSSIVNAADSLKESKCGIIGIPVRGLYQTNGDLWYSCIETLLDITLRLLPVDGSTEIELDVERRGAADGSSAGLLQKMLDDAQYHLSLVSPEKAKNVRLSGKIIAKQNNPYNGYADLVAFSWGCGKIVRQVLSQYGWLGPCLIAEDPGVVRVFHRCLELIHVGGELPVEDWNVLVTNRQASSVGSLIGALLRAYGEEARQDSAKWRKYLDYVLAHLDSKAIRMSLLMPQISWLKEYEPAAAQLPPRFRLVWLTAQLAASNHQGGTAFGAKQYTQEFKVLSEQLKDEDAPLVCFAALHLAVEKTDSYEFEAARDMLQSWENEPIAVPGLRYHAQVLSSLGQHAAFLGDNNKALEYFKRAMDEFSRLSSDWQRDFDQTCAYAVIAAMDAASPELERLMAMYLYGGEWSEETMIDMAHQFAAVGEDEPESKYAHAILLRYLVTLPADDPIRLAYLADFAKWKWCEDGHPWELIAFYRALLLSDGDPARGDWLKRGYELCLGGGPTLQAIAAVIGAARLGYDGFGKEEYLQKVDEIENLLPNIGAERIAALRSQADNPLPLLELATKVLPFNFR
ncbi:MAG: hypothetical protein II840_07695 [Kiritimatiellae bacterium]|nr:hypothetical protein [Kiritimatiellia bacterium]